MMRFSFLKQKSVRITQMDKSKESKIIPAISGTTLSGLSLKNLQGKKKAVLSF